MEEVHDVRVRSIRSGEGLDPFPSDFVFIFYV